MSDRRWKKNHQTLKGLFPRQNKFHQKLPHDFCFFDNTQRKIVSTGVCSSFRHRALSKEAFETKVVVHYLRNIFNSLKFAVLCVVLTILKKYNNALFITFAFLCYIKPSINKYKYKYKNQTQYSNFCWIENVPLIMYYNFCFKSFFWKSPTQTKNACWIDVHGAGMNCIRL